MKFDFVASLFAADSKRRVLSHLFLQVLALIYFAAFFSLSGQINGLVGPHGILPVAGLLEAVKQEYGALSYLGLPTLFWLNQSAWALQGAAYTGCALAVLLFFGVTKRATLIGLFLLYLSLTHAGQVFLNFQWDSLLLETGFLAIFLANGGSRLVFLLFYWLLFRLRFFSGVSKLVSGDTAWADLSAVPHYFSTQPLPHAGAWFAHQLPEYLLRGGTLLTFTVELVVPFFIFLPRRFRIAAALITVVMQLLIIATSNHNFINLLTIALCLLLLDDRCLPGWLHKKPELPVKQEAFFTRFILSAAALLILGRSLALGTALISNKHLPEPLQGAVTLTHGTGLGNVYHVFPTMQTERQELRIEGSYDGFVWLPYRFKYKPNDAGSPLPFIVPHQPRLDWMIWFVPTQNPSFKPWFDRFMMGLWKNEPAITGLLAENPFQKKAPRYLRVLVERFHFTTAEERKQNGNWWKLEYIGEFPHVPPRRP